MYASAFLAINLYVQTCIQIHSTYPVCVVMYDLVKEAAVYTKSIQQDGQKQLKVICNNIIHVQLLNINHRPYLPTNLEGTASLYGFMRSLAFLFLHFISRIYK